MEQSQFQANDVTPPAAKKEKKRKEKQLYISRKNKTANSVGSGLAAAAAGGD
jgi:hypothetical protein